MRGGAAEGGAGHGIKTTPAMEAGVTDFLWSMEDIALMSDTNGQLRGLWSPAQLSVFTGGTGFTL